MLGERGRQVDVWRDDMGKERGEGECEVGKDFRRGRGEEEMAIEERRGRGLGEEGRKEKNGVGGGAG